jgi:Tol biopolymer transport system component
MHGPRIALVSAMSLCGLVVLFGCGSDSTRATPGGGDHHTNKDTIPPYVGINAPIWGAAISGNVSIEAEADDASGVARVYFEVRNLCDSAVFSFEDATEPYEAQWNSGTTPDGGFTICAAARDSAGNTSDWTCVDVHKGTVDVRISRFVPVGVCPGDTVNVYGEHFGSKTQKSRVAFGGSDVAILSWNDSTVQCVVPQGLVQDALSAVSVTIDCYRRATKYFDVMLPGVTRLTDNTASDGEPTFDPTGQYIYFSSNPSGTYDIYRIRVGGGTPLRITYDAASDNWADIHPSGAVMVWGSQGSQAGSNPEGDYEILSGDPFSTVSQLTSNDLLDRTPHWSPTNYMGYSICYSSYIDSSGYMDLPRIMLYSNTQGLVKLTAGENPTFSPNGREVVFQRGSGLYKIGVDGTNEVQLTTNPDDSGPHWCWATNKIVFQRFGGYTGADIYVMDADGSDQHAVIASLSNEYSPAWSPDGTKIVYAGFRWSNLDIYVYEIP